MFAIGDLLLIVRKTFSTIIQNTISILWKIIRPFKLGQSKENLPSGKTKTKLKSKSDGVLFFFSLSGKEVATFHLVGLKAKLASGIESRSPPTSLCTGIAREVGERIRNPPNDIHFGIGKSTGSRRVFLLPFHSYIYIYPYTLGVHGWRQILKRLSSGG